MTNVDKLEDEHNTIIIGTTAVIKKLSYGLAVTAVAFVALLASVIIVGSGMEKTHTNVGDLETVIGSIENIRTIAQGVDDQLASFVREFKLAREIPKMKVIMDTFTKDDITQITPLIPTLEKVKQDINTVIEERFIKYPNTNDTIPRYHQKYNAGFRGFGCHIQFCDFSGQTKTAGISTLDGCLSFCGGQWENANQDVSGATYDAGQNSCYCVTGKVGILFDKSGFINYVFPKFKSFARKSS